MAHHKCEISCADLLSCQADDATSQEEGTAHMTIMIALLMKWNMWLSDRLSAIGVLQQKEMRSKYEYSVPLSKRNDEKRPRLIYIMW